MQHAVHVAAGHPTYRYHYRSVPKSPTQPAGAFHSAEVLNVFGTRLPLVPSPKGTGELDAHMGDRWVGFARTGKPNHAGREVWPAYDPANPRHMVFDRPTSSPQACPSQPGLDVMRERVLYLSELVTDT
jgi:carboxylesterase type B